MRRAFALVVVALAWAGLVTGCQRKEPVAGTPPEAYMQLYAACAAKDAGRLYLALDTQTQWAIETVHRAQREMQHLIVDAYPPEARDQALSRLPAACEEPLDRPRRYYRRLDETAATLEDLARRLQLGAGKPVGSIDHRAGTAELWREGGSVFHFARDDKGRWGYSELRAEWQRAQERALHDLDTVKENAALYRRAGGQTEVKAEAVKGNP